MRVELDIETAESVEGGKIELAHGRAVGDARCVLRHRTIPGHGSGGEKQRVDGGHQVHPLAFHVLAETSFEHGLLFARNVPGETGARRPVVPVRTLYLLVASRANE